MVDGAGSTRIEIAVFPFSACDQRCNKLDYESISREPVR